MNTTSTRLTLSAAPQELEKGFGSRGELTPLARRIAAVQPKPEPWKPAWMRQLKAKDLSGAVLR